MNETIEVMSFDELMIEVMGALKGVETLALDQQRDDEYDDPDFRQRIDARADVAIRELRRIAKLVNEIGEKNKK